MYVIKVMTQHSTVVGLSLRVCLLPAAGQCSVDAGAGAAGSIAGPHPPCVPPVFHHDGPYHVCLMSLCCKFMCSSRLN